MKTLLTRLDRYGWSNPAAGIGCAVLSLGVGAGTLLVAVLQKLGFIEPVLR